MRTHGLIDDYEGGEERARKNLKIGIRPSTDDLPDFPTFGLWEFTKVGAGSGLDNACQSTQPKKSY